MMNTEIIFEGTVANAAAVSKMLTEDSLFATRVDANTILKTLGTRIDRIETNEGTQKIYIKPLENVLFG